MPTTSVARTIAAPQAQVWAALADIQNAGRWNTAWAGIEITSGQEHGAGTTFRARSGDGHAFDFQVTHWDPPHYIAFAPVRDASERYAITLESHAFHLRPADDDRTRVELIASASAHGLRGHLVGLFFWAGYQKHGLNSALDGLQALFEPPDRDDSEPGPETPSSTD